MIVECSKCGNLDDTSAHTVVLPEFLCRKCTQATTDVIPAVADVPKVTTNQIYEDIFRNLNDSEIRTLIEQLKNEIPSLYPQGKKCACGHLDIPDAEVSADEMLADMQIQLEQANNKIAEMTIQSNNEHHRGDLYRDWYRETYQKYMAERDRTWWSRLCN